MNIIYEYNLITNEILKQYINTNKNIQPYFKTTFGGIVSQQYCGILNCNGEDFYILPKISNNEQTNLNIFTYMLLYSYDIDIKNEDISSSTNHIANNIFEVFIKIFAKELFKQLQSGVYKTYITYEDNLRVLKGKYLVDKNIQNFSHTKIYCQYDEFSMDNTLNQFFLYAIKTLLRYTKDKRTLAICETILDEVSYKQFDINTLNIHFDRLNTRFQKSYNFAMMILKKFIPMFEKGNNSFAFLFDMNELFEKFIGNIYKSIDSSTSLQNERNFGNLKLIPDIITKDLIIDTKYKLLNDKQDLKRDDKYQMYVYGNNFNIKNTMLLYPKHQNSIDENLTLGKNDKKIYLKLKSIDLFCDNIGYKEYIEVMEQRVMGL